MIDEYAIKMRKNSIATDAVTGYLATINSQYDQSDENSCLKLGGKKAACELLLNRLQMDFNTDPIDILAELKSDMDYEESYAIECNRIKSSIIFEASSNAYEEILYLLL